MKRLLAILLLIAAPAFGQAPPLTQGFFRITNAEGHAVSTLSAYTSSSSAPTAATRGTAILAKTGTAASPNASILSTYAAHLESTTYSFSSIPNTVPVWEGHGASVTIGGSTLSALATFAGRCRSMTLIGSDGTRYIDSTGTPRPSQGSATGSGDLVFGSSPTLKDNVVLNSAFNTLTGGFAAAGSLDLSTNGTAASGFQYYSSPLIFSGAGFDTGASASRPINWRLYNLPVQGNPATSTLAFDYQYNGGGYANKFAFGSDGTFKDGSGNSLIPRAHSIIIAAADSPNKVGADVICTGTSGGTHNDQTAIAAAINGAPDGANVVLRLGTYHCSAALAITRKNVTVQGESRPSWGEWGGPGISTTDVHGTPGGAQIVFYNSSTFNGIENNNAAQRGVSLRQLYIRTDNGSGFYTNNGKGVLMQGTDFNEITDCTILGWDKGIDLETDTGRVEKNWIEHCNQCVSVTGSGSNMISHNVLYSCQYGAWINCANNELFRNQIADFSTAAVLVSNSVGNIVSTNEILNPSTASANGVECIGNRSIISNNQICLYSVLATSTSGHGIIVGNGTFGAIATTNVAITGNQLFSDGAGTSTGFAVKVDAASSLAGIVANEVSGGRWNSGSATTISAASGNVVLNNSGDNQTISTPLTITAGKSASITNSLTFSGTDSTTMTFPSTSATIARTDATNTFTGASTATSWNLVTPLLGTPTSGTLTNCTGYTAANLSGLGSGVATWLATPSGANLAAAMTNAGPILGPVPSADATCTIQMIGGGGTVVTKAYDNSFVFLEPIFIPKAFTSLTCKLNITSAAAAGKVGQITLYDTTTVGRPNAKLAASSSVAVDAIADTTFTVTYSGAPGWYWFLFTSDGVPTYQSVNLFYMTGFGGSAAGTKYANAYISSPSLGGPNPIGTVTGDSSDHWTPFIRVTPN